MITNAFKLFGVNTTELNAFLSSYPIKTCVTVNGQDVLIKIDYLDASDTQTDKFLKDFISKYERYIYANEDVKLSEQLVKILTVRKIKIASAESFTGGAIASEITKISGASKVFYEGVVAYTNEAKNQRLGVKWATLDTFKAVSSQVAYEMCSGLLKTGDSNLAVSTTGIAGPLSDDSNFPVGLCYIGVGSKSKITVYKHDFKGNREEITRQGVEWALFHAVMALKSGDFDA